MCAGPLEQSSCLSETPLPMSESGGCIRRTSWNRLFNKYTHFSAATGCDVWGWNRKQGGTSPSSSPFTFFGKCKGFCWMKSGTKRNAGKRWLRGQFTNDTELQVVHKTRFMNFYDVGLSTVFQCIGACMWKIKITSEGLWIQWCSCRKSSGAINLHSRESHQSITSMKRKRK